MIPLVFSVGIARALGVSGLSKSLPHRFYYHGPMFRYEQPQRGRSRQFEQLGIEAFGLSDPLSDVEQITMASDFLSLLGLKLGQHVDLRLNTLGDVESRAKYRQALHDYLQPFRDRLSAESRARLQRGSVLRILDSKYTGDQQLVQHVDCPKLMDYMSPASRRRFDQVRQGLEALGYPAVVDPCLVRGLDYYHHTVFEFVFKPSSDNKKWEHVLGSSQATVLAGGRYDGLVETIMGRSTESGSSTVPCIGWAAGLNRLMMILRAFGPEHVRQSQQWVDRASKLQEKWTLPSTKVLLIRIPPSSQDHWTHLNSYALQTAQELRRLGIPVLMSDLNADEKVPTATKQMLKMLKKYPGEPAALGTEDLSDLESRAWAELMRPVPDWAVFIGEDEVAKQELTLKHLPSRQQARLSLEGVFRMLKKGQISPL